MTDKELLEAVYERIKSGKVKIEPFYMPDNHGRVLIHVYSVMEDGGRCGFDHEVRVDP